MDKQKLRKVREIIYWARVVSRAVDHPITFTYNPYEKEEREEEQDNEEADSSSSYHD